MTKKIGLMIVDDHDMVRRGLASFLSTSIDIELVGEAADGEEAVRVCEQVTPDIVLMDFNDAQTGWNTELPYDKEEIPKYTGNCVNQLYQEKELVHQVIMEGAISYLLKNVTGEELIDAIRKGCAGKPTMAPEITQALYRDQFPSPGDDLISGKKKSLL